MKQNRKTHDERAKELASMGAIKSRLVDVHGLSIYLSIPVSTLEDARGELPRKWTQERFKAEMEKGFVSPPFIMMGGKRMYDLDDVDKWKALLPRMGELPEEAAS